MGEDAARSNVAAALRDRYARDMVADRSSSSTALREIRAHTGMRGVAALFVVAYHLQFLGNHLAFEDATPLFRRSYLFVDLFFVLSGFIISYVNRQYSDRPVSAASYRGFLLRRFCRLYPLLLFTILCLVAERGLLMLAFELTGRTVVGWSDWSLVVLLLQILMLNAFVPGAIDWNIPSWSISAEVTAYVLFPFAARWLVRRPWLARGALLLFATAFYVAVLDAGGSLDIVAGWAPVRCLAGFALGMLLHDARAKVAELPSTWLGLGQTAALAAIAFILASDTADPFVLPAFALLVVTTWTDTGPVAALLASRPLRWLGTISYSIYLNHLVVLEAVAHVLGSRAAAHLLGAGTTLRVVLIATSYAATILASALTYRFVELRGRAWLTHRLLHRRAGAMRGSPPAP